MKKTTKLILLPLVLAFGATGFAHADQNCAAKRAAIEYQISQAKAYGNFHKVAGLEQSLSKINMYCGVNGNSSAGNAVNNVNVVKLEQKVAGLERAVSEKQSAVREVELVLAKAQARGDYKQVAKLQRKIADMNVGVAKVQAELNAARAALAAAKR